MADPEHLAVFQKGAEAWNGWRRQHPEIVPDLRGATLKGEPVLRQPEVPGAGYRVVEFVGVFQGINLSRADLRGAVANDLDLSNARLDRAQCDGIRLTGTVLRGSDLERADFTDAEMKFVDLSECLIDQCTFDGAALEGAHLERCVRSRPNQPRVVVLGETQRALSFQSARLQRAIFSGADVRKADFRGANLQDAEMSGALLKGADFRNAALRAKGLEFDENAFEGARMSPHANDRWSILRRTYTGPNLAINLVLLLLFLAPMVAKGGYLWGLSSAQEHLVEVINQIDGIRVQVSCTAEGGKIAGEILRRRIEQPCVSMPMWKLLLGFGGPFGLWMPLLTCLLLAYQIGRAALTREVSLLRETEERSRIAPSRDGLWAYSTLYQIHQVVRILYWISLVSFSLRAVEFLLMTRVLLIGSNS